jgi:hypothetical protein
MPALSVWANKAVDNNAAAVAIVIFFIGYCFSLSVPKIELFGVSFYRSLLLNEKAGYAVTQPAFIVILHYLLFENNSCQWRQV